MATCYRELKATVFNASNSDVPCSGSNPTGCCAHGDFCMSNGICHYTQSNTAGSGYYLQSCTDVTFQSPIGVEVSHCTTLDYPDIVYNATTGLWACCSSDPTTGVHCSTASNETWAAPAPEALVTLTSIEQKLATSTNTLPVSSSAASLASTISPTTTTFPSASTPSSSVSDSPAAISTSGTSPISMTTYSTSVPSNNAADISTSTSTSASTSTSSSAAAAASSPSSHKTRLSPAASAGIGVGVVFGLIALVALTYLAILTFRKRKSKRQSNAGTLFGGPDPTSDLHPGENTLFIGRAELGTTPDTSLLSYANHRPPRFTGEPQFLQEISGVPVRYEAIDHHRYEMGSGRGLW